MKHFFDDLCTNLTCNWGSISGGKNKYMCCQSALTLKLFSCFMDFTNCFKESDFFFPPCFSRCGMTEHTADCCHQTVLYNGVLHFYNHPHSHSTKLELIFSQICISPFFSWQNDTNVAMLSNRKTSNLCYFAFVIICWKLWYLVLAETHVCRRKNRH